MSKITRIIQPAVGALTSATLGLLLMSMAQAAEQPKPEFVDIESNTVAQLRKKRPNIEQEPCGQELLDNAMLWDECVKALNVLGKKHIAGLVKEADFSPVHEALTQYEASFEAYQSCHENNTQLQSHSP